MSVCSVYICMCYFNGVHYTRLTFHWIDQEHVEKKIQKNNNQWYVLLKKI
jgi:hypothetical protein